MQRFAAHLMVCLLGCNNPPPAPSAPAPVPPPPAPSAPAPPAAPKLCEVEVFGTLKLPPKVKPTGQQQLAVYVADNDCLAPDANILGRTGAGPEGRMFIEVFTKWGSDITICGALEEPGKPARYYGKAEGKFHAEAEGEVMFRDVVVNLKAGPPHKFPQPGAPVPAGPQ